MSLGRTPSQTVGPFFSIGLCNRIENELVSPAEPGALRVQGRLLDGQGDPIADGMIEVWDAPGGRWGRSGTDADGRFSFVVAKPAATSGAPHLEVAVFCRGLLRHQLTRLYFPDESEANRTDPFLSGLRPAEQATLVGVEADGDIRFDIHMQGPLATTFFAH